MNNPITKPLRSLGRRIPWGRLRVDRTPNPGGLMGNAALYSSLDDMYFARGLRERDAEQVAALLNLLPEIADALDAAEELRAYAVAVQDRTGQHVTKTSWLAPSVAKEVERRLAPLDALRAAIAREVGHG